MGVCDECVMCVCDSVCVMSMIVKYVHSVVVDICVIECVCDAMCVCRCESVIVKYVYSVWLCVCLPTPQQMM